MSNLFIPFPHMLDSFRLYHKLRQKKRLRRSQFCQNGGQIQNTHRGNSSVIESTLNPSDNQIDKTNKVQRGHIRASKQSTVRNPKEHAGELFRTSATAAEETAADLVAHVTESMIMRMSTQKSPSEQRRPGAERMYRRDRRGSKKMIGRGRWTRGKRFNPHT